MSPRVFEVVAEANRYFANAEPWKLAKADPARMRLVLYVTTETLRVVAILLQPIMPASMAALLDLIAVAPEARAFAALDAAPKPAVSKRRIGSSRAGRCPRRRRSSPATSRREGRRRQMMLIDSHCHLDFPDFADDLDAVVARAHAAGVERMITIGTRVAKAARAAEIAERYDSVFFTVGTHPHEAAGEADGGF